MGPLIFCLQFFKKYIYIILEKNLMSKVISQYQSVKRSTESNNSLKYIFYKYILEKPNVEVNKGHRSMESQYERLL